MNSRDFSWLCLLLFFENIQAALSPNGENVCLFEERYIKTIQVREMVPVKVMKVRWCWKMPPRCTTEETELRPQIIDKEVPRTRIVAKCCRGYASDISDSKCIPVCSNPCIHGICTAPDKCSCESGFYGDQCNQQCQPGYWGRGCVETCDCENDAICGNINGECTCLAGWQGARCEFPCNEGYYGLHCDNRCNCKGDPCDHVNGTCLITTTEIYTTAETITTPEILTTFLDDTTTQQSNTDDYYFNLTTILQPEDTTDLSFVNITESTTEILVNNSSSEIIQQLPNLTLEYFTTTIPTTKAIKEEINSEVNEIQEILIVTSTSTERDNFTKKNEISNEIEYSQNFKTITVKSQIERVNLFGLIPSLSLVSGIAVFIFLISMGLLMYNHWRRVKKMAVKQDQVIKINPADLGIHKFYGESTLPVKTIFENPVYSTDVDFEKDQPTLQSFKPLPPPVKMEEKDEGSSREEEVIRRSSLEATYERPTSNRSTSNEHLYHEISVIMNYDIPKRISGSTAYYS